MAQERMYLKPDGSVQKVSFAPWLIGNDFILEESRILQAMPLGTTWQPWSDADEVGLSRKDRHKWRHQNGQVIVDQTIPDPPDPRQALKQEIAAATTVADLKTTLLKLVGP